MKINTEDIILMFGMKTHFIKTIGIILIALPTIWDLVKMGLFGLIEKGYIVIHIPGILTMVLGATILYLAGHIDERVGN